MKPTIQHRGRELLHVIALLNRCLQIPCCAEQVRAGWERDLAKARRELEGLYASGLDRSFIGREIRRDRDAV